MAEATQVPTTLPGERTTSTASSKLDKGDDNEHDHHKTQEEANDSDDDLLAQLEAGLALSERSEPSSPTREQAESNGTINEQTQALSSSPTTASLLQARKAELLSLNGSADSSTHHPGRTTNPSTANGRTGLHTLADEAALIRSTADAPAAVVVFHSLSFARSQAMRSSIADMASAYHAHRSSTPSASASKSHKATDREQATIFLSAEAEKHEWLARRLGIKALPVVIGYIDGREVGRIVGFEGVRGAERAGWRGVAWIVARWNLPGSGVGFDGEAEGLLGRDWDEWIIDDGTGGMGNGRVGLGSSARDDLQEREERRAMGYVGGGGGNGILKGARMRTRDEDDDDDDWD